MQLAGEITPFFLYLRSFLSDRSTTEKWAFKNTRNGTSEQLDSATPKAALEYLLQEAGPLVEIGGHIHLGLGRVKADQENWWDTAMDFIIHATAIFLNPDTTESLTREIDFIIGNTKILRRTFLVMEPTHLSMKSAAYGMDSQAAADRMSRWSRTRDFFWERSVVIPEYKDEGALISLYHTHLVVPFMGVSRYKLYDLMHRMYVDLGKLGSYDIDPTALCPCKSDKMFVECHGWMYGEPEQS